MAFIWEIPYSLIINHDDTSELVITINDQGLPPTFGHKFNTVVHHNIQLYTIRFWETVLAATIKWMDKS